MSDEKDEKHAAFAAKLDDCVEDEAKSHDEYMAMADEVEAAHPGSPWAGVLRDMAREEACHAKHLESMKASMSGR